MRSIRTIGSAARRGLVLAILLLPPLAACYGFYRAYTTNGLEISEKTAIFDRLRAVAEYGGTLDRLAPDQNSKVYAHWYLGDDTPAMLTAGLQQRMREVAAANSVDLVRASDTPPKEIDTVAYLGVRFEMSGTASGMHKVLGQIEASVPLLVVDNVQIRSSAAGETAQSSETVLYVDIEVTGASAVKNGAAAPKGESP